MQNWQATRNDLEGYVMMQVTNLERLLTWIKSCPYQFTISSMSGGYVHVKFLIPFVELVEDDDMDIEANDGKPF